jgi:hypothetical protein
MFQQPHLLAVDDYSWGIDDPPTKVILFVDNICTIRKRFYQTEDGAKNFFEVNFGANQCVLMPQKDYDELRKLLGGWEPTHTGI